MAGTWDVPGLLRTIPATLYEAWQAYWSVEPWDSPSVAVSALLNRRGRGVSGDDPEGLEQTFRTFAGAG